MTFIDHPTSQTTMRHWHGGMEADHYLYTSGVAGEAFFTVLRDEGQFLASECVKCQKTYIPAFLYCWHCLERLDGTYQQVEAKGTVETYTVLHIDADGAPLDKPEFRALIRIGRATNRFLHKLSEVQINNVQIGLEVQAVLKPKEERKGQITDILHFRPAS